MPQDFIIQKPLEYGLKSVFMVAPQWVLSLVFASSDSPAHLLFVLGSTYKSNK